MKYDYHRLLDVTKAVTSKLTLDEALQTVVDAIAEEVAGVDLVGYFDLTPDGIFVGRKANKVPILPTPDGPMAVPVTMLSINPKEDTYAQEILDTMAPVLIADAPNDSRPDPMKVKLLNIKTIYGLPVHYEGEMFGLIFLHDVGKPMEIPEEKRTIVESFVAITGVVAHNAQMFEDQQRLLRVARELSASLSVQEILDACFRNVVELARVETCGIHFLKEENGKQVLEPAYLKQATVLSYEDWIATHQVTGKIGVCQDRLFQEVVTQHRAIAVNDVYADDRPNHDKCRAFGIESLMVLPMVAGGECLGVVAVPSIGSKRVFTPRVLRLVESIASITAITLRNALTAQHLDDLVRQKTSELQQAVTELKTLDKMKSDFVSMVSHELRTPINIITQIVDLFQQGMLGDMGAMQEDYLEKIAVHTRRLREQVEDLLDFSKLESGAFQIHPSFMDYGALARSALDSFENTAKDRGVRLVIEGNTHIGMIADRKRLEQVLVNLLSNAIKFTPEAGEVRLMITIEGDEVFTRISDTGIGIPKDKLDRIFEKFYQIDNSSTRRYSGTGLGLTICKNLVEKHGGSIWATSEEGKGSCFCFTLPVKE